MADDGVDSLERFRMVASAGSADVVPFDGRSLTVRMMDANVYFQIDKNSKYSVEKQSRECLDGLINREYFLEIRRPTLPTILSVISLVKITKRYETC